MMRGWSPSPPDYQTLKLPLLWCRVDFCSHVVGPVDTVYCVLVSVDSFNRADGGAGRGCAMSDERKGCGPGRRPH